MTTRLPDKPFQAQQGLTLMEVLIYAVLSLGLLLLAVTSLGHIQKSANRSQEMARLHADADEAVRMLAQDTRNLGLKRVFFSPSSGVLVDTQLTGVDYSNVNDSSSFIHKDGNPYDGLVFIKPQLNSIGKPISIDTIEYKVNTSSKSLFRTVNGLNPVEICKQVDALQFAYGVFANKTVVANEPQPTLANWAKTSSGTMTVAGSALKMSVSFPTTTTFWFSKTALNLDAKHTYELTISTSANTSFLSKVSSMSAVLCDGSGNPISASVQSFLPTKGASTQYLQWAGINCTNCYVGFKMVMNGSGDFFLNHLTLQNIQQSDGAWSNLPTNAQKKAVRAIRLYLLTQSSRAMFGKNAKSWAMANVNLSFDDNNGRSLLEDVIPIPNNGY
jgi:type II secretory pathway pseudopilin PulG